MSKVNQDQIKKYILRYAKFLQVPEHAREDKFWDLIDSEKVYELVQTEVDLAITKFKDKLPGIIEQLENSDAAHNGVTISELVEDHFR